MLWSGAAEKFPAGVFLPIIWAHPPVEYAHRSITQAGNNERTLGVAGKAGHTAVCSRWDVLVETYKHTHPPKKGKVLKRNLLRCLSCYIAHFTLNLLGNHQSCALLTAGSFQVGAGINMQPLVSVLSPSIKAMISRPSTIRCVKTEKTEETTVPQHITTSLPKQPRFCAGHTAHTEALSSSMQVHFLQM